MNEQITHILARLEAEEKRLADSGSVTNWILDSAGARWLFDFICEHKPSVVVECGTSVGYSTIWLAAAVSTYGGRLISIEKDPRKHEIAKQNLQDAGLAPELILGDAGVVLQEWTHGSIDLLFLDANKKGYLPQFLAAEPHLAPHATVAADNVIDMAERVQDFIDFMREHPDFATRIEEVGDGLLVCCKK